MPPSTPTRRACPRCGAPLPHGSEPGTEPPCGACLLLAGLGEEPLPEPPTGEAATLLAEEVPEPDGLGLQLGGYLLIRQLGHGSMGVIYEARQPGAGRHVALKTINRALLEDADVRTRFAREAEAAASLDHPNLLPVHAVGEDGGRPYFTMKLAEGGSLLRAMPRYAGRPREAVALMAKVARGIAHAHGRGVLHRDLKPGNVLLDADGETPLVADFGLARWLDRDSDLTQSLVVFGTPGYMAPEQARHAGQAGPAADVYSMGAMLFQLLCGRTPFRGANAIEVIEQARAGPAPSLRAFNPKAARDLETICARCLEFEPTRRPRCAADLAEDLERWLAGRPIRLRPVRLPERAWRWSVGNPWLTGAVGGCLLLAVLAGIRHRESVRLKDRLTAEAVARDTIAVLPLEDLDQRTGSSPLSQTLNAELNQRLSAGTHRLWVPVAPPPGSDTGRRTEWQRAGQVAKAPVVLSGTVRRLGGADGKAAQLRVTLRLVIANDGLVLGQRVLTLAGAGPAAGTEVTAAAIALTAEVSKSAPPGPGHELDLVTRNEEARNCLEVGKTLLTRRTSTDLWRAASLLQRATELDPSCALAHALLASAHAAQGWTEPGNGWSLKAHNAAAAGLRLDPSSAEAHRALGMAALQEGQWQEAMEASFCAYELDPAESRNAHLLGWCCHAGGRLLDALAWFERSASRGERSGANLGFIANVLVDLGDDGAAESAYRQAEELSVVPNVGCLGRCRLRVLQGRFDLAREEYARLLAADPRDAEAQMMRADAEFFAHDFTATEPLYRALVARDRAGGADSPLNVCHLSALGHLLLETGREEEGRALLLTAREQALASLRRVPSNPRQLYNLAAIHASMREKAAACEAFEQAVVNGWVDPRQPALDPRFDNLRGDPRFNDTLSRLSANLAELRRQRSADPGTNNPTQP